MINKRQWGKWAEKKKKETELSLIQQMEEKGMGVADIIQKKKNKIMKNKEI